MDILPLIVQLASGGLGGIAAGKLIPKASLGNIGNLVAGIAGGGLGGQLLNMLGIGGGGAEASGGMDISSILTNVAGGGVGGGVLMTIIGFIKGLLKK
jgi:uncharacterized membrane protein YeaQ/YmgE (transglycosylase-associated protein family)